MLAVRADRAVRWFDADNQPHKRKRCRDEGDSKNALLEVRSGSGGDEAAAFAKELFEMYRRFAELKGWKFEGLTCSSIDAGMEVKGGGLFEENNREQAACGSGVDRERGAFSCPCLPFARLSIQSLVYLLSFRRFEALK